MNEFWAAPAAGGAAVALTLLLTPPVIAHLKRRRLLDNPNDRSSHVVPTPRGGGLAVTPAALAGWVLGMALLPAGPITAMAAGMTAAALALMLLSWMDDRVGLPPGPRLALHGLAVAGGLALLPDGSAVFGGLLPVWADRLAAGLGWLWFVNLYNFMDGIDGITGVKSVCLGGGIAAVAALAGGLDLMPPALALAGAGAGFLVWNWHPAKVFLGDVGSVPLGYLAGGLLILLATRGYLAPALILASYYLADSTITLTRRALAGEKVWQAHRKHFYQRAVQGGRSHAQVSGAVAAAGLLLVGAALAAAAGWAAAGSTAAIAVTGGLLLLMSRWAGGKPS